MKKRVLFVDDELPILEGLKRALRPMNAEWDMGFIQGGQKALEVMSQTPFDVIVTDLRMPGMSGAELLHELLRLHPNTVRLILSGYADAELMLKCVGVAHQYLSKPCDLKELKAAVSRALGLEQSLQDDKLRRLVARLDRLPSIPALYSEIVEKLQDPDVSIDEIGAIVAKDIAMTAKILKLVNSAFFGLGREISNPADAVSYLGIDTVKALVLSVNAFSQFSKANVGAFSIEGLWAHSQQVAGLAKDIAQTQDAGPRVMDQAFVAGLLHDTGKLILASNFPSQYDQVLAEAARGGSQALLTAEETNFGANHARVGGYLLGLWGLPGPVVEAIALHHHPSESPTLAFAALTAVNVADALVNSACGSVEVDLKHLHALGLASRLNAWRAIPSATPKPEELKNVA